MGTVANLGTMLLALSTSVALWGCATEVSDPVGAEEIASLDSDTAGVDADQLKAKGGLILHDEGSQAVDDEAIDDSQKDLGKTDALEDLDEGETAEGGQALSSNDDWNRRYHRERVYRRDRGLHRGWWRGDRGRRHFDRDSCDYDDNFRIYTWNGRTYRDYDACFRDYDNWYRSHYRGGVIYW